MIYPGLHFSSFICLEGKGEIL